MIDYIKKYYLFIIIFILLVIIISIFSINENDNPIFEPFSDDIILEEVKYIYVDIKGEILNPGVYKVEEYTRLFQVISLAGGVSANADILAFNLSSKLYDQEVIYIPSIADDYPLITDVIEFEDSIIININRASLELLDTLPGIGPSTAQSIIDYRNEFGEFEDVEDLINVPGIGEVTMNEIRDFITI